MSKGGWKTFGSSCLHPWGFPRSLPCKPHPENAGDHVSGRCVDAIQASFLSEILSSRLRSAGIGVLLFPHLVSGFPSGPLCIFSSQLLSFIQSGCHWLISRESNTSSGTMRSWLRPSCRSHDLLGSPPHTKEGPGMSHTYTCHSNKDRSMSLSVYVRSESLNHKGSDTLGESDGLSQPSTNTRNDGHKLVPWGRYRVLLNLVWVERWGRRRDLECNTHDWQSLRLPIVKVAQVTNFTSWALVAKWCGITRALWSHRVNESRRRHCHQKSCLQVKLKKIVDPIFRTVELVQEPLAVNMDVKKVRIIRQHLLQSFLHRVSPSISR